MLQITKFFTTTLSRTRLINTQRAQRIFQSTKLTHSNLNFQKLFPRPNQRLRNQTTHCLCLCQLFGIDRKLSLMLASPEPLKRFSSVSMAAPCLSCQSKLLPKIKLSVENLFFFMQLKVSPSDLQNVNLNQSSSVDEIEK